MYLQEEPSTPSSEEPSGDPEEAVIPDESKDASDIDKFTCLTNQEHLQQNWDIIFQHCG